MVSAFRIVIDHLVRSPLDATAVLSHSLIRRSPWCKLETAIGRQVAFAPEDPNPLAYDVIPMRRSSNEQARPGDETATAYCVPILERVMERYPQPLCGGGDQAARTPASSGSGAPTAGQEKYEVVALVLTRTRDMASDVTVGFAAAAAAAVGARVLGTLFAVSCWCACVGPGRPDLPGYLQIAFPDVDSVQLLSREDGRSLAVSYLSYLRARGSALFRHTWLESSMYQHGFVRFLLPLDCAKSPSSLHVGLTPPPALLASNPA